MNTPVNFEIAKLLKEKECVIKPLGLKNETDYVEGYEWDCEDENDTVKITEFQFEDHVCYFRYLKPTIAEVVMWLYEKHGVWISVGLYVHLGNMSKFQFTIETQKHKSINSIVQLSINPSNSPTEAYSAGIEYTLKNLTS
jgi:hypothetical protein